jgi:hypothetical protein
MRGLFAAAAIPRSSEWNMTATKNLLIIQIALLSFLAWPLNAQQPPARPAPAPLTQAAEPRPGPETRRLAYLVGAWEEKVRYPSDEPGQKEEEGTGRWFARPVLGRFLQFNYEGMTPQGAYHALGMLSYDREAQGYRLLWSDDAGGVGDYRGNFVDENILRLEHRGAVEGREFRERISFLCVSAGEVRTKIEQAWEAGAYRVYLEASATRTGAPPQELAQREHPPARRLKP